jgi:hypothetical protein
MAKSRINDTEHGKTGAIGYGTGLAILLGAGFAVLTLNLEKLSALSRIPLLGDARPVLFALLFPGILGSMAFSGNAHAWHLWVSALINGLIYFVLAWIVFRLLARMFRKKA